MAKEFGMLESLKSEGDFSDWREGLAVAEAPAGTDSKVRAVLHEKIGHGDYAETEVEAVFTLDDGTISAFYAGCDTSGWDCPAGGEYKGGFESVEAAKKWLESQLR